MADEDKIEDMTPVGRNRGIVGGLLVLALILVLVGLILDLELDAYSDAKLPDAATGNCESVASGVGSKIRETLVDGIRETSASFFSAESSSTLIGELLVAEGLLDISKAALKNPTGREVLRQHLWAQMRAFPELGWLFFTANSSVNMFMGYTRSSGIMEYWGDELPTKVSEALPEAGTLYRKWPVDASTGKVAAGAVPIQSASDYKYWTTSYYKSAIAIKHNHTNPYNFENAGWVPLYLYTDGDVGQDLVRSSKEGDAFLGLWGAGITLAKVQAKFSLLPFPPGTVAWLLDPDWILVGSNTPSKNSKLVDGKNYLLPAIESDSVEIVESVKTMKADNLVLPPADFISGDIVVNGKTFFMEGSSLGSMNISLTIFVISPASDESDTKTDSLVDDFNSSYDTWRAITIAFGVISLVLLAAAILAVFMGQPYLAFRVICGLAVVIVLLLLILTNVMYPHNEDDIKELGLHCKKSVDKSGVQLREAQGVTLKANLDRFFSAASLAVVMLDLNIHPPIYSGILNFTAEPGRKTLGRYLWTIYKIFPELSWLYFASDAADNVFMGYFRWHEVGYPTNAEAYGFWGDRPLVTSTYYNLPNTSLDYNLYNADPNNGASSTTVADGSSSNYKMWIRPWFKKGINADGARHISDQTNPYADGSNRRSEVYALYFPTRPGRPEPTITTLRNSFVTGNFAGVWAADLTLKAMQDFLLQTEVSGATIFIVDEKEDLIASNALVSLVKIVDGESLPVKANACGNAVIESSAAVLNYQATALVLSDVNVGSTKYFYTSVPYKESDVAWLVVVVQPNEDAKMDVNLQQSLDTLNTDVDGWRMPQLILFIIGLLFAICALAAHMALPTIKPVFEGCPVTTTTNTVAAQQEA